MLGISEMYCDIHNIVACIVYLIFVHTENNYLTTKMTQQLAGLAFTDYTSHRSVVKGVITHRFIVYRLIEL